MRNNVENIKLLFSQIRKQNDQQLTQDCNNLVGSLQRYFKRKKMLSDRQFDCLREIGNSLIKN